MPTTTTGYEISLPEGWQAVPLGPGFEDYVREQQAELAEHDELTPTARRRMELLMRQLRNSCRRSNVTMAACLIAVIDEDVDVDGVTIPQGLLTASVTASTVSKASLGTDLPITVNTTAAALALQREDADDDIRIVDLEAPELIDMPAGRVVQTQRLHHYTALQTSGEQLSVYAQQFLLPFGSGEYAAVVNFTSATVEYAKPLSRLFTEMMKTFRLRDDGIDSDVSP